MEVVTTHINADFDAMASMIAAKKLYPDAVLVFPGSQERTLREFFINSTMYIYDFKRLRDVDLTRIHRLILVDTRQISRIGRFEEIIHRPDVEIHIYDHHPDTSEDIKGQVSVVKPVGATVTILTQLLQERGIELNAEEATILSLGIYEDTGSFTFNSTTPEDFEAAAYLRRFGADLNVISDLVTQELTAEQVGILNELILSARTYDIQGIEVCIATVSVDKYVGDFALLVHKLKDIHNLDVVFALGRMEDRIYLVARSRIAEVDVGQITAHFGGGGHTTAASATIRDLTLNQAEDRLLEILKSCITPFPMAETLMSSPVTFVEADATITEAEQIMVRYNINSMPVMEKGVIVGLITRQVLEKAIFHKLSEHAVRELMSSDFMTVSPQATLLEIQTCLVEHQQRILPVLEDGKVVGVITRRDLLNFLVRDHSNKPQTLGEALNPAQWPKRKSINSVVMEQLPHEIVKVLRDMGRLADQFHFKIYAIGGFVRDLLLRRPNLDIDIVVEGDGIEFAKAFAERRGIRARCHKKFNTAVLIFSEKLKVDVASARFEYYQYPAALPIVEFSSLKMDLYRRDFTINTLALALNPDDFGQLIDFFGGQRDLKEKTIRVLHNLSFVEDPTRIMRAIRFEQRFNFRIGKQTANLIKNAVRMGLIQKLGGRRFFHEIESILREENPVPALRRMDEYGVLSLLSSDMRFDARMEELFDRIRNVISWYRLSFLDEPLEGFWVYFLGLLSGLREKDLENVSDRLVLSETRRERLIWTYRQVEPLLRGFFQLPEQRPSDIYRTLQPFRPEELLFMMARTEWEAVRRAISHYFHRYRNVCTELKGRDLKAIGVPPGPIYRVILDELLDARLNGAVRSRQDEWAYLKSLHPELFKDVPEESRAASAASEAV
ncbi:CBS domain-containing protein [Desulforhabdus sp. TSK]|uniref:CBS domain-containing protein n=1 Tax=Desulforhabdus sp. TSK TaxID=2925014 RepID=UPI001FC8A36D|nr:CBS domain-containing protein [Desulforhabdus sp. TSK]GKT07473.1 poly(A) polymerase [Desulforhabdus sp. TSK]